MTQAINDFLAERKAGWLKARLKPGQGADEEAQLQAEAAERFAPVNWLPDAAKRAGQLTMATHPSKFSHPSAQASAVIASCEAAKDGYLRTGNVCYEMDVFGNAAAMDVYKFLTVQLEDGRTVQEHLEADTDQIRAYLTVPTASYQALREGFAAIKQTSGSLRTDPLVKQVYFPVGDDYHLLSLLTPAGLLTQMKSRIDTMRFGDAAKEARDCRREGKHHAQGFDDVVNTTVTAFGGTKPQNISVLNAQNRGQAYLLASLPPGLERRQIPKPTHNFFKDCLLLTASLRETFQTLHRLMKAGIVNKAIKDGIGNTLDFLIDQVLERALRVRALYPVGWSDDDHYQELPLAQKIWLDDKHQQRRDNEDEWLDDILGDIGRWLVRTYQKVMKDAAVPLSDHELNEIKQRAEQAIGATREVLK